MILLIHATNALVKMNIKQRYSYLKEKKKDTINRLVDWFKTTGQI